MLYLRKALSDGGWGAEEMWTLSNASAEAILCPLGRRSEAGAKEWENDHRTPL